LTKGCISYCCILFLAIVIHYDDE